MRYFFLAFILIGCSASNKESTVEKNAPPPAATDSSVISNGTPPPPPLPSIKPNMSMMGAEVTSIQLNGDMDYVMGIVLRTALPYQNEASLVEPGQELTIRPAYEKEADGAIYLASARNKRLFEQRMLKVGDPIIGKISLFQDGLWYLVDTTLD